MSRTIKLLNINANEKYKPLHPEWFLKLKKMNFGTFLFFGIAVVSANLRNYYGMWAQISAVGISRFWCKMTFWYILVQNDRVVRTPWDEIDGKFDDGKFAPTKNNRKINFFDLM